jgi:hypothetical protein
MFLKRAVRRTGCSSKRIDGGVDSIVLSSRGSRWTWKSEHSKVSDKIVCVREQRTETASMGVPQFRLGSETIAEVIFLAYLELLRVRSIEIAISRDWAQHGVELSVAAFCRTARCDGIL